MVNRAVASLPSPVELGFPEKFSGWYSDQVAAIDAIVLNSLRFIALIMPTGSGKKRRFTLPRMD